MTDTSVNGNHRELAVAGAAAVSGARAMGKSVVVGPQPPGNGTAYPEFTLGSQVFGLFQNYAPLAYMLPWQTLDYIELLSTYNPDMSQAVDNVRTLANSGHNLFVIGTSELQTRRIKMYLEEKARTINERGGGIDGLIDQLLDQAAVYGAMAGEWVVDDTLSEVVSFTVINPKHIRFFWDYDLEDWAPYQKVNMLQQEAAKNRGQKIIGGCVQLNPQTFHYYAFDAAPGSPYGTPPFLAALPNISVQRDMINNMSQIVKKVGLLGIIDMVVERLPPKPGEQEQAYQRRAGEYLDNYVAVVENMVRDGGVVHFDDMQAKTYNITGNAAGATNIFKQNEELIFSGLKSMPSVQGRCLDPATLILMADGTLKRLDAIELGDLVQGFDEHTGSTRRRWKTAKVENLWHVRKKSLRLHLSDGRSVLCSEDHPFLMQKQNSGIDKLSRRTGNSAARRDAAINAAQTRWHGLEDEFKGTDWKRASSICPGEWIKALDQPLSIDYDSDDYKAGYISGVCDGDGCWRQKSPDKQGFWQVAVQCSDDVILDYCEMFAEELGLPESLCRYVRQPNTDPIGLSFAGTQPMSVIKTGRAANISFLTNLAVERDSDDYKAGWLAGLFDTDGSKHLRDRGREQVRLCQKDGAVKDRAERFLADLGFVTTRHENWIEVVGDRLEKWRFTATIRPALDRKVVKLDGYTVRTFKPVRVERVETVGFKTLIDMTTTTATFVGDGLLTHNSYSTTETYAGVAYDIIIRNTYKYQRSVKRMIESGYWLMATLAGFSPDGIELQFLPNKSLHRLQDAQATRLEIFNALLLWAMGFIDQTGAAQILGYQQPVTNFSEPPASPLLGPLPTVGTSAKSSEGEDTGGKAEPQPTKTAEVGEEAVAEIVDRVVSELQALIG